MAGLYRHLNEIISGSTESLTPGLPVAVRGRSTTVWQWARVASRNSTTRSGRTWTGPWSSGGSTPGTRNVGTDRAQGREGLFLHYFLVFKISFHLFVECLLQRFFQLSEQRWKSVRWNKTRLVASKTGTNLLPPIKHKTQLLAIFKCFYHQIIFIVLWALQAIVLFYIHIP